MSKNPHHDPSYYRQLIRDQKSEKKRPSALIEEAKTMSDPYYIALALIRISEDKQFQQSTAAKHAFESIDYSKKVERPWRRAELLAALAKNAKKWRSSNDTAIQQQLLDSIFHEIKQLPKGKGLSQNIDELGKHIGCKRISSLLDIALHNKGFILHDTRSVLRQWAMKCSEEISIQKIYTMLKNREKGLTQTKLMGYLYLQSIKSSRPFPQALKTATQHAAMEQGKKRVQAFRYLIRHIQSKQDFLFLFHQIMEINKPEERAQLLCTLAAFADKKGFKENSQLFFNAAEKQCNQIKSSILNNQITLIIAKGLYKAGQIEKSRQLLEELNEDTIHKTMKTKIEKTMEQCGFKQTSITSKQNPKTSSQSKQSSLPASTGNILSLYDTYEGALKPIHFRMLARAAPLCSAYGLDLALMGFPIKQLSTFINRAIKETTIGHSGKYIKQLAKQKRIIHMPCSQQHPPSFSPQDTIIATTAFPDTKKKTTFDHVVTKATNDSSKKTYIIMGLGKKGLPPSILKKASYHVELTGLNIPLETSTAMGIIALMIYNASFSPHEK